MDLVKRRLTGLVWRVHSNPTELPTTCAEDVTPPNRFDDPKKEYRVRYFASNKRGSFLEYLSRFRPNDEAQKRLAGPEKVDESIEPQTPPGIVTNKVTSALREVKVSVRDPGHEFVDVADSRTQVALNTHRKIQDALRESGLGSPQSPAQLDEATIRLAGPRDRVVTQAVSRVVYDETAAVGIHYSSRIDSKETCWAVYDWVEVDFSEPQVVDLEDPELRAATSFLNLTLESARS